MSVTEFSTTFKNRIRNSKNLFKIRKDKDGNEYLSGGLLAGHEDEIAKVRKLFKAANRNNVIITKQGLLDILSIDPSLKGIQFETYANFILEKSGNKPKYLNNPSSLTPGFIQQKGNLGIANTVVSSTTPNIPDPWVVIEKIPYDNIAKWTKEYLVSLGNTTQQVDTVFKKLEIGHTVGIFSYRAMVTFGSTIGSDGRIDLRSISPDLEFLDRISQLLIDLDIATTNSAIYDMGVYGHTVKDAKRGIMNVELQLKATNQQAGNAVKSLGKALASIVRAVKKNTNGSAYLELEALSKVLQDDKLVRFAQDQFSKVALDAASQNLNELLHMRSSPSFRDMLEKQIIAEFKEELNTIQTYTSPQVYIDTLSAQLLSDSLLVSLKDISKELKKSVADQKELLKSLKLNTKARARSHSGQFISLTSIQSLINRGLADQLQKNMGKGNARSVLNYRTGRFANSAQVDRLTIDRDGTISAFYSYMKSPYQTFEPGFAQGFPESRDPRRLISKSIRELASEAVSNRLKAVSV